MASAPLPQKRSNTLNDSQQTQGHTETQTGAEEKAIATAAVLAAVALANAALLAVRTAEEERSLIQRKGMWAPKIGHLQQEESSETSLGQE